VVRSAVAEVPAKGRDTMGVVFARFAEDDRIIAVAKNSERDLETDATPDDDGEPANSSEQPEETQSEEEQIPDGKDTVLDE
jgi:DNA gyrase subunit A